MRTGLEEGAREAQHALATQNGPRDGAAGREHDNPSLEVEPFDFAGLKKPVFVLGAGREEDRRALGMALVRNGVRGQVQNVVAAGGRAPSAALSERTFADEHFDIAEVALERATLSTRVGKAAQAQTLLQRRVSLRRIGIETEVQFGVGERQRPSGGGPWRIRTPVTPERCRRRDHQFVAGSKRR